MLTYAWDFGDGGSSTVARPSHTFASQGSKTVTLTVTDDRSATSTATVTVDVTAPPVNAPPVAVIATPSCTDLVCSFDGSGSTDPEGGVLTYAWDFGDGGSSTVARPSHTFASQGSKTVTLTVTDDRSATSTATVTVDVTAPTTAALASDSFSRTVTGGFGTADAGGAWTAGGPAATLAVSGGLGTVRTAAGGSSGAYLNGVSSDDTDLQLTLSTDKDLTGGGLYAYVIGRRVLGAGDYLAKVRIQSNGAVTVQPERVSAAGSETTLAAAASVPGLGYSVGDRLRVRLQVTGTAPTSMRVKLWKVGAPEPSAWLSTVTDSTAGLQVGGGIGLRTFLSGSATNAPITLGVADLRAVRASAPPVNQAPTARFSSSCVQLACDLDGSASTDPEGATLTFAWDFGGDGASTAVEPSHTFGAAGTYAVTLTVTDDKGAVGTVTKDVVVTTAPPVNQAPTARFSSSCVQLACDLDGSASTDPEGATLTFGWDFGGDGASTAVEPSHTFGAAGTYAVTLTVTDDKGAVGTVTKDVVVAAAPALFAQDLFDRSVTGGWGAADIGGAWTTSNGSSFAVSDGEGVATLGSPSASSSIFLNGVSATDTSVEVTVAADKAATGGGIYLNVAARRTPTVGEYRAKVRLTSSGAVALSLVQVGAKGVERTVSSETVIKGLSYTPGMRLRIRFEAVGTTPTTLRAKVWSASASEPTAWAASVTDSTPELQGPGGVGVFTFLSGSATNSPVTARFDDFTAGPPSD